jgi:hypothetical protein
MALAQAGAPVLVTQPASDDEGAVPTAAVLADLGIVPARSDADILLAWRRRAPALLRAVNDGPAGPGGATMSPGRAEDGRSPAWVHAGTRVLRLVGVGGRDDAARWAARARDRALDVMLVHSGSGEAVALPTRQTRIDTWIAGRWRIECSCAERPPDLRRQPLLPRRADAASLAVYVQRAISGESPLPPPIATQIEIVLRALVLLGGGASGPVSTP